MTTTLKRKCSIIARTLSTAMADTTRKDTPAQIHESEPVVITFATQKAWAFRWSSKTICRAFVGWTIKPTSKSAKARQQSRMFDGVRKNGVLETARRINMLPTTAERAVREFIVTRMTLVTSVAVELYHSSSKWKQFILVRSRSADETSMVSNGRILQAPWMPALSGVWVLF